MAILLPAVCEARAAPEQCPPGWYCEPPPDTEELPPAGEPVAPSEDPEAGASSKDAEQAEVESALPPLAPEPERLPAPQNSAPQNLPPAPEAAAPPSNSPRIRFQTEPVPPRVPRPWNKFGVQARLSGALLEGARNADAGAAGLGVAFRYRPARVVSLELGADGFWGRDFAGDRRSEFALSVSTLLSSSVRYRLRPYVLAGLFVAGASVQRAVVTNRYTYLGGQLGFGMEYGFSRNFALGGDLLGFVRTRTDRDEEPEFVDLRTGRATNTSGGGLLRVHASYYF